MDIITGPIKGIYHDVLYGPDGQIIEDRGWRANTIVNDCRLLLAEFMRGGTTSGTNAFGLQYMLVGQGPTQRGSETDVVSADANETRTKLDAPYAQQIAPLVIAYLDDNDNVIARPSPRLQITATLGVNLPTTGEWQLCEFGLFAQIAGSIRMINYVRHVRIDKPSGTTLERVVRLYF